MMMLCCVVFTGSVCVWCSFHARMFHFSVVFVFCVVCLLSNVSEGINDTLLKGLCIIEVMKLF